MPIVENQMFPKLTGEDAKKFIERAAARVKGENKAEIEKIKEGLKETMGIKTHAA